MPKTTTSSSSKLHTASSVTRGSAAATAATFTSTPATDIAIRSLWDRTFSNGDTYRGEALYVNDKDRKPVKDGKGCYTWASSGAAYDGDWKGGLPHGTGVVSVPGVNGYEYTGEFKDGKRSGKGCCQFSNGRVYEGEWREDEMNGTGTLRGASNVDDFTEYTGGFQNGMRSGRKGRCIYANGDIYDGAWAAGKRQGFGEWQLHRPAVSATAATAARPVRYRGAFERDAPQASSSGEAELEYADGSLYAGGTDAQMRRHGMGVHRLANGDVFEGSFAQDQREGKGILQGSDGAVCEGYWHNGQLNGEVRITFAALSSSLASASYLAAHPEDIRTTSSASIASLLRLNQPEHAAHPMKTYHGPCVAGIFTGSSAIITYMDGSSYHGAVRNGVPHGAGILRDRPLPCSTGARGTSADGVVRKRIPATCVPLDVLLTLIFYEGTFSNGEADGSGTGEWHTESSTQLAPSHSSSPTEAPITPHNFMQALGTGLRCWTPVMYGRLDGTYTGNWARGLPHGQGIWQWSDGSRYSGGVAQYVPSGAGTLTSASSVQYTGDLQEGQAEGSGVWEDKARGLKYEGQWLTGQPHGSGVATLLAVALPPSLQSSAPTVSVSSHMYEGSWADGKPSGQGREYTSEDRRHVAYEGGYVDGFREGEGTISFDDAGGTTGDPSLTPSPGMSLPRYLKYKGNFLRGAPGGGTGCLTLSNKTSIEGGFDAQLQLLPDRDVSIRSGNETWTFKGVYYAAKHTGCGVMTFANGDVYNGEVEDASCGDGRQHQQSLFNLQRHGHGTYKFVEGNQLRCTWRHNVLHGAGTYTSSDGVQTERKYVDGVLVGDAVVANDGGCGGAHLEVDTGAIKGNVFTPENEFPNTLSAEALKSRMPELQRQSQSQSRKRQPFAFIRKGEARQASAAGEAAVVGSAAPTGTSSATPVQRRSPRHDLKDAKRQLAPPPTAANQKRSPRTSAVGSAPLNDIGANGGDGGGSHPRATRYGPLPSTKGVPTDVSSPRSTPKYSLRRPQRAANNAPPPATVPSSGDGTSPTATVPTDAVLFLMRRAKDGTGGAGATAPTSSAYLSKFQAGIRQLDAVTRADSATPSTASGFLTPTATDSSFPVATSTQFASRGRLSSALAAGRAQEVQQRVLKPLKGSLKALMDAASSIRNSQEDEIHLLTEELRALNERIWQLRFTLASKEEEDSDRGAGRRAYVKAAPPTKATGKRSSTSKEDLDALVQERRVIMEKLQYVLNESVE
ncbi:MORN repeat [Leishmania braziliensis]|nr:MORN repeat [Leishmania braziliensis]